jgi:hypothetical protein
MNDLYYGSNSLTGVGHYLYGSALCIPSWGVWWGSNMILFIFHANFVCDRGLNGSMEPVSLDYARCLRY